MTDDQNKQFQATLLRTPQLEKPLEPVSRLNSEELLHQAMEEESKGQSLLLEWKLKDSEIHFVRASQAYLELGQLEPYLRNQLMYISVSHGFEFRNNLGAVQELQELETIAEQNNILRALGLIKKVKSCLLFDSKNVESALFEIEQAERLLRDYGFGESQEGMAQWVPHELILTKIQKCDCWIEVGERDKAKELFTEISADLKVLTLKEEHKEIPIAFEYLNQRLGLKKKPEVEVDEKSPLYWSKRFTNFLKDSVKEDIEILTWFTKTGHFVDSRKRIYGQIKVSSFEGRLIQYLSSQSGTKDDICTHLWPGEPKSDLLRTRFHSLVKRINYKIRDFVLFNGETYHLGKKIKLKM